MRLLTSRRSTIARVRARRRAVLFSVLLSFAVPAAAGQPIAVAGRVVDAESGRAVSGARVAIGSSRVLTDAEGRFQLEVHRRPLGD